MLSRRALATISIFCYLCFSAEAKARKDLAAPLVSPNCIPVKIPHAGWQIALCSLPEKKYHYPAEIRFFRGGKIFFKHLFLYNPTGGYPAAEILAASERFALLELGGDETNQVIAFDLDKKAVALNTGEVTGMSPCVVKEFSKGPFCDTSVACPVENYTADISIFLCPEKH